MTIDRSHPMNELSTCDGDDNNGMKNKNVLFNFILSHKCLLKFFPTFFFLPSFKTACNHPTMEDELANNWGCNLVYISGGSSRTFHQLDSEVRSSVPGFQLLSLEASGTSANETAIGEATNFDLNACMYAVGSYVGGSGSILGMSTSGYAPKKAFCIPADPDDPELSDKAKLHAVAFPYWVTCHQFTEEERKKLENECLNALHKRILISRMVGEPFTTILFEHMLCGSGGELSHNFLERLASLLLKYGITIVVDEVMTGGRVGPKMTMTSSAPAAFREAVGFVTMGKVFDCGIVLK